MIRLIVAASANGVIGRSGKLPWQLIPEDRKWLLEQIKEGVVILGRKSFEETAGPLPGVHATVVVTSRKEIGSTTTNQGGSGVVTTRSSLRLAVSEATRLATFSESGANDDEENKCRPIWICGGERIYREALLLREAHLLYLTRVHHWIDGDTRFPSSYRSFFPEELWRHESGDKNYNYTFSVHGKQGSSKINPSPGSWEYGGM